MTEVKKGDYAKALRKEAGRWLKEKRVEVGYTQADIAEKIGKKFFTFVSQIENGTSRVPPEMYVVWAAALNMDVSAFTKHLMKYYDPFTYAAIFEPKIERGYQLDVVIDGKTLDQWADSTR